MFMVDANWFMDTCIARLPLIIYYHSQFYSLGYGASVISYCPIITTDSMIAIVSNTRQSETYESRTTLSLD